MGAHTSRNPKVAKRLIHKKSKTKNHLLTLQVAPTLHLECDALRGAYSMFRAAKSTSAPQIAMRNSVGMQFCVSKRLCRCLLDRLCTVLAPNVL